MSSYSKIKKYYFTGCIVMLAVLIVLAAESHGWNLSLQTMMSVLAGWFVMCAAVIGIIFWVFNRRQHNDTNNNSSE